jgi:hypothetical protein
MLGNPLLRPRVLRELLQSRAVYVKPVDEWPCSQVRYEEQDHIDAEVRRSREYLRELESKKRVTLMGNLDYHKYKEYYRTNLIKSYLVGERNQREFVAEASEKLHIMPTTEGGADLPLDLTHIIDGLSVEHQLPIFSLYKDVVNLVAQSGAYYTPTFIIGWYGGPGSEDRYFETTDVHDDPKMRRFISHNALDSRTARRMWFRKDEYNYPLGAASAEAMMDAGRKVCVGGHGELQGLSYHWEPWSLQAGGMTNLQALRAGTINGAEAIGLAQDLGSLEPGKLAGLVVLDKDPLQSIQNTTSVRFVMKNGELFDGNTLDEVWPQQKTIGPFWWWKDQPAN